jgi:hypothetical protein
MSVNAYKTAALAHIAVGKFLHVDDDDDNNNNNNINNFGFYLS